MIWSGKGLRLTLAPKPDGKVHLIRATDYDSGPAQMVEIEPAAIGPLISALWRIQFSKTMAALEARLRSARGSAGA